MSNVNKFGLLRKSAATADAAAGGSIVCANIKCRSERQRCNVDNNAWATLAPAPPSEYNGARELPLPLVVVFALVRTLC